MQQILLNLYTSGNVVSKKKQQLIRYVDLQHFVSVLFIISFKIHKLNFNAFGKTWNYKDDTINTCMSKSIHFTKIDHITTFNRYK